MREDYWHRRDRLVSRALQLSVPERLSEEEALDYRHAWVDRRVAQEVEDLDAEELLWAFDECAIHPDQMLLVYREDEGIEEALRTSVGYTLSIDVWDQVTKKLLPR